MLLLALLPTYPSALSHVVPLGAECQSAEAAKESVVTDEVCVVGRGTGGTRSASRTRRPVESAVESAAASAETAAARRHTSNAGETSVEPRREQSPSSPVFHIPFEERRVP
mmetsp:Transcript_21546/g.37987  ORF Transcript_21546/g.37987 Transcript_21546/m.37987 type:complete len:111 (+) Transcript_21546:238-570(+)